jgi:hypothetical protein
MRIAATLGVALVLGVMACGPRRAEVRTAPVQGSDLAVQVTNTLASAVNVYIASSGTDTFLRQVGANSTETIPVRGFAAGSTVTLKAVTIDGTKTYTRANVVLSGTSQFPLP